ncbi:NAD(P)-dependent alcohol dehydrogenase [Sorangium sp. So ce1078]|uniref:NAD(P)-dependent alcohol dehydrogenase n=1 Tax=Sorangium sp. So ce1078 TaxID=3133329 RepID=UPI003F630B1D
MKAAVYDRYGSPEVLEVRAIPAPEPRDHEVRIAIRATTATAACQMMRRGDTLTARLVLGLFRPRRRFRVLGIEIAGTVERVGRRVTRFRSGDRVFGFTGFAAGGYAEYVCLPEHGSIAHAPEGLSHEEACSLVDGPTTALYFLRDRARLRAGERIAVVGASGSIGTAAVQLARHVGAEVTAVCSGRNAELVRSLGAHHVVDYAREDYAARADAYHVVFDTVGASSFSRARRCLSRGGRYLVTVGGPELYLLDAWSRAFGSKKLVFGMSVNKKAALPVVSDLVARGALRPVIDRRYPLEAIADAHRYVETGRKRGNVVIDVGA